MPPDLPAELVAEIVSWLACDECGGTGWQPRGYRRGNGQWVDCDEIGCSVPLHHHDCPRPHTVIVHEGRRIHADPGRMETVCNWHRHPGEGCNGEWPRCRLVLRPEIPLDLGEA